MSSAKLTFCNAELKKAGVLRPCGRVLPDEHIARIFKDNQGRYNELLEIKKKRYRLLKKMSNQRYLEKYSDNHLSDLDDSSEDDTSIELRRYTIELKKAGVLNVAGVVLSDARIMKKYRDSPDRVRELIRMKEARCGLLSVQRYARQRGTAKRKHVFEEPDAKAVRREEEEQTDDEAPAPGGESCLKLEGDNKDLTKQVLSVQNDDKPACATQAVATISRVDLTLDDDDKPAIVTPHVCQFCGDESCAVCPRMQRGMPAFLFLMRVGAVYNHAQDSRFYNPGWTTETPSHTQAFLLAKQNKVRFEVTETQFDDYARSACCEYCGCLPPVGVVIKGEGDVTRDNLVACCMTCSLIKGDVPHRIFLDKCAGIISYLRECPGVCTKPIYAGTSMCYDHFNGVVVQK